MRSRSSRDPRAARATRSTALRSEVVSALAARLSRASALALGVACALACSAIATRAVADSAELRAPAPPAAFGGARAQREVPADSEAVVELLRLADAQQRSGDRDAERAYLSEVIALDSAHSLAHARLAELTGRAPAQRDARDVDPVRVALAHPYDPAALVAAATRLAQLGDRARAVEFLERAVWLADLDPTAALAALRELRALSAEWSQRRVVPVQLHADAQIRAQPGWQFQLRTLWSSTSARLDGVLQTRFVPIAIAPYDADDAPNDLDALHEAFRAEAELPAAGFLAFVTGRPAPGGDAPSKKGVAEFLGRSLAIRLAPGALRSRVLAHEILHLYGAIHVLGDADSLMNPTGESDQLDAPNARIVRALRAREFGPGGIEANVLPQIDLRETVAAYRAALSVNLSLREAEIADAQGARHTSADALAFRLQRATQLDAHLADAARLVAALMLADARRAEALRLLELSSQLYGASTPRGLATAEEARRLRESIQAAQEREAE